LVYSQLFQESKDLCDSNGIHDEVMKWGNDNPVILKDYVENKIFLPYLDALIDGIKERFGERQKIAFKLQSLLPSRLKHLKMNEMSDVIKMYEDLLPSPADLESEVERWMMKWNSDPNAALDIGEAFSDQVLLKSYPNVITLLQVLHTLPVSTATPERSFSTLGRIYSDVRSCVSMCRMPRRVSNLSIIASYKEKMDNIDIKEVLDAFSRMANRRLELS
jgi:hypothetical protein